MGIPKLSRDLESYRQNILLGHSPERYDLETISSLIIDGPGLVYFVYYRLLINRPAGVTPLDAQPSYHEICTAVRTLLKTLQSLPLEIEGIYFDGALPHAKREVRLSRTEKLRTRLENFCKACPPSYSRPIRHDTVSRPNGLSFLTNIRPFNTLPTLPEPPFMVPAVVEYLHGDRSLAAVVHLVNGEADKYCASYARRTGSTILSNDSDFYVFDLGEQVSILSLDSLTISSNDQTQQLEVYGLVLRPQQVAAKLHLDHLSRLAFERSRDQYVSFNNLITRAKTPLHPEHRSAFDTFLEEYKLIDDFSPPCEQSVVLDTRFSELYYQLQEIGSLDATETPQVYLPFLIENHSRTSSWTFGVELRILAYSLVKISIGKLHPREVIVDEYMRSGGRIVAKQRRLDSPKTEIAEALDEVLADLQAVRSRLGSDCYENLDPCRFWRIQGIFQVCKALISSQRALPDRDWLAEFLSDGYVANALTLDAVHIEANVNAALYSLRMLKQSVEVALSHLDAMDVPNGVKELQHELQTMPDLCRLMASRSEISQTASPTCRKTLSIALQNLYELLEIDSP